MDDELETLSVGVWETDNDMEYVGVTDSVRVREPRESVTVPVTVSEGVRSFVKEGVCESVIVVVPLNVKDEDTVVLRDSEKSLLAVFDRDRTLLIDFDIVCSDELEME